uniref:Uncharacterized protein n=1 Tax=Anopheles stephensi TaxID=30069 RepID=A0A182YLV8_ANOST
SAKKKSLVINCQWFEGAETFFGQPYFALLHTFSRPNTPVLTRTENAHLRTETIPVRFDYLRLGHNPAAADGSVLLHQQCRPDRRFTAGGALSNAARVLCGR